MSKKRKQAWTFTLSIVIIVSLAACGDYSSSVTSLAPVQTPTVELTDSANLQETPSAQPTGKEQKNKYFLIKCDTYDGNGTLIGRMEYEYDENGNLLRDSRYSLDGIVSERIFEYTFYQDGTILETRETYESPEWSSISNYSYDEHGNMIVFDAQHQEKNPVQPGEIYLGGYSQTNSDLGRVYSYAIRTFTYDSNGHAIRFDMTSKNSGEVLGWGEIIYDIADTMAMYNVYDRNGELSYQGETLYDADHRPLSVKYLENGEITDWFEYEYDEYGHRISSSTHLSAGDYNESRWVCMYDSEGKFLSETIYWDDTLMSRSEATEWIPFPTVK